MSLVVKINGTVSVLRNVTNFHYFPLYGELAIYCKDGSWMKQDVKVEGLNSFEE